MTKQEILQSIAKSIKSKHPWKISEEKYIKFFGELPQEFLEERIHYDNLLSKSSKFKLCNLILSQVKIEVNLNLDQLIDWELALDKYIDARAHNITVGDIKKILKDGES